MMMLNALCVIRSLSLLFVLPVFVSSFETLKHVPVCIPTCSHLNHPKLELYYSTFH